MLKVVCKHGLGVVIAALAIIVISANFAHATEDVDYNVSIAPSLNLTIPSNPIIINLDPSSKTFDSKDFSVVVATNNRTGYTLTLSTPNDNTNLNRDTASDGVSAIMPTLDPGTYTQSTFTPDKWGYKINSNTSIPSTVTSGYVPFVSGNTLMESDTAVNHDEAELSLAAKIDYLQPSGSYSTTLNFNIVAHPNYPYIQNLDPGLCTSTPMSVVDKRDYQVYTIQRLKDGNCWMIDNLNLGAIDLTEDLTSSNTNLSTSIDASDFNNQWRKSAGSASYTTPELIPITSGNSTTGSDTDPVTGTKYGTAYNYCAATAGTICTTTNGQNASYDICPAGWRLPTGGTPTTNTTNGEFQYLYNYYNSYNKMHDSIANGGAAFALAGFFYNTTPIAQNVGGYYWSSTRYDNSYSYRLYLGESTVNPTNNYYRYYGSFIRCILDTQKTMQNFSNGDAAAMNFGEDKYLQDVRDGQVYRITKLSDGNVWMTQNLNFTGNTMNSTTSNVASNYTVASPYTPTIYDAATYGGSSSYCYGASPTGHYNGDTYLCRKSGTDVNGDPTTWYNGPAATAGTATNDNTALAVYSVCPAGWRLPTKEEEDSAVLHQSEFRPVYTGYYLRGALYDATTRGDWWSATRATTYTRCNWSMKYQNGTLTVVDGLARYGAVNVRCVKNIVN